MLGACSNFLDKAPQDEVSNDDALIDIQRANIAMIGTYSGLLGGSYYFTMMMAYPEYAGGNIKPGNNALSVGLNRYERVYAFSSTAIPQADATSFELDIYGDIYKVISRANNIIEALPTLPDGTEAQKNNLTGEAKFMRALAYFDLVRIYGQNYRFTDDASHLGIPALRQNPQVFEYPRRNTVKEVYDLIIEDLQDAATHINANAVRTSNAKIWLSVWAAKALLARVYLYQGEWQKAIDLCDEIIASNQFQLASQVNYSSIWRRSGAGKQEVIFEIDMGTNRRNSVGEIYGQGQTQAFASATNDLIGLFNPNDIRGTAGMIENYVAPNGNSDFLSRKFIFSLDETYPIVVLRLAELHLARAEALAELGLDVLARADLNLIRQRANPNASNINASGTALKEEIGLERRREFAFEGHLFFDLTRRKRGVIRIDCPANNPNCNVAYPSDLFVLPIPQKQLDANSEIVQNPGY